MLRLSILVLLGALAGAAAAAADWGRYVNPRFGAAVDIPPGFAMAEPAPVNGDGRRFEATNGRATIIVWGGHTHPSGFAEDVAGQMRHDEAEGWALNYRSQTPDWAAWSGSRAGRTIHVRSILTCGGRQTANVRLVYPAVDLAQFDAIATRLGNSLAQDGGCY